MVVIVMGVAGSGKTTVGSLLAGRMSAAFHDADDFHSALNKAKTASGVPLTDEDRAPWLSELSRNITQWLSDESPHVLACSALKRSYREELKCGMPDVWLAYLRLSKDTAKQRLAARTDHYMKPGLIDSQFETLEEPAKSEAIIVNAELPPQEIVEAICKSFTAESSP